MREQQGEKVSSLERLNKLLCVTAERSARLRICGGKTGLGEETCKDHGNKAIKLDSLIKSSRCRYRNVRPHSLPPEPHSFVGMARETAATPPA